MASGARGGSQLHGAPPGSAHPGTALDYVIGAYSRHPEDLSACIGLLLDAGGVTRYNVPAVLTLLRGRTDELAGQLAAEPELVHRRFPELDFGTTGARRLTLQGATLLHVAAEYGSLEAATLLLGRGADVNARATVDAGGSRRTDGDLSRGDSVRRLRVAVGAAAARSRGGPVGPGEASGSL